MKLKADQLASALKKHLLPVYLITGDEPLLCQEAMDLLRSNVKAQGFSEREILHADTGFNWNYLLECSQSMSLFGDKKLIELRITKSFPDKNAGKVIVEYLANPSPDNILVITAPKTESKHKKAAWFKAIEQSGAVVEIWPIELAALGRWIQARARSKQFTLSDEAIELLKARVEGNLLAAAQEIEKLALVCNTAHIEAEDIINAVSDSSRYDVFGLTEAAVLADPARCQKILNVLQQDGTEPTIILWALSREVRTLYALSFAHMSGQSSESVFSQQRVWGKRKNQLAAAQHRLSVHQLQQLLSVCLEADQMIKGQSKGDPWLHLSIIALTLAGHTGI